MLTLDTGSTENAEKFFKENIGRLGKIISIEHIRNSDKVDFETIITGELEVMDIKGGLASGYAGTGPHGLIRVLKELGISEDEAITLVKGNRKNEHSFRYDF